jgi:hypothetical protein
MKLIKVEDLRVGMRAAKNVLDQRGVLLYKAGTTFTDEIIIRLKDRMITHVYVDQNTVAGLSMEEIKRRQEEIDSELTQVFSDVLSNPIMSAICESAKRYLRLRIQEKGSRW